jgi:serine/threonine protein kinase/Flp pilus assembly protein TadD
MDPETWYRVKELVADALERPPSERAAFLRQACSTDEALRQEADRLIENYERAGDFLSQSPFYLAAALSTPSVFVPGDLLAERFRVVQLLGRGGMGEVYEAEDLRVSGERIALKILRPEISGNEEHLARFRREMQLARRVTHRNVCRVFDLGHHNQGGRELAFVTMELLSGETLARFLARRNKLPPAEALTLAVQLADGLEALHKAGVVHRDFKPGNVILTPSGDASARAVITDFGLARTLSPLGDTSGTAGSRGLGWGTPDYMAPEQLAGQSLGSAADVYAFGLVLYEMLSGEKPFPGGSPFESVVQRATLDPIPLRSRLPDLDHRTERVVMRCLERRPKDRPAALSATIRALTKQGSLSLPALASKALEAVREARPLAVVLICVAALLAMASFVASSRFMQQGWINRPAAREQYIAVLPLAAEENSDLQAVANTLTQAISSRLSQFQSIDRNLVFVPASEVLRQRVHSAGEAVEKFSVAYAVEGHLQQEGERLRLTFTLIDPEKNQQLGSEVVEGTRSRILNLQDGAVLRLSNLLDLHLRPKQARHAGEISPVRPGPDEFYHQGLVYLQRSDDLQNIDTAIDLFQHALETDERHAHSQAGLAEAYWYKHEASREERWVQPARQAAERALALNDQIAHSHLAMGLVHNGTGAHEAAISDFERALALEPRNGRAFEGLGRAQEKLGSTGEAETAYLKAVALRSGDWLAYKRLGLFYYGQGQYEKAAEQYERVVELTPDNAHGYANLGGFYLYLRRYAEAETALRKAISISPTAGTISNLGKVYFDQRNYPAAITQYERAAKLTANDHRVWQNLAASYWNAGRGQQAEAAYRKALRFLDEEIKVVGRDPGLLVNRAHCQASLGDAAGARATLTEVLRHELEDPRELASIVETYGILRDWVLVRTYFVRAIRAGFPPERLLGSPDLDHWPGREEMQASLARTKPQ